MNLTKTKQLIERWRSRGLFDGQSGVCNTHSVIPLSQICYIRYGLDWLRFSATRVHISTYNAFIVILDEFFHLTGEVKGWREGFEGLGLALYGGIYKREVLREKVKVPHEKVYAQVPEYRDEKGHAVYFDPAPKVELIENVYVDMVVDFPATALDYVRSLGFSDIDLLMLADSTIEKRIEVVGGHEIEVEHGLTCARVDVCMDCYDKRVSPNLVLRALDADVKLRDEEQMGCVLRKFQNHTPIYGVRKKGQPLPKNGEGMTVNLGRRGSSRSARVYDKRVQMLNIKGVEIPHCTRFEMECLHDGAEATAKVLLEKGLGAIPGLWSAWVDFKDETTGTRLDRCESVWWWKRIVGGSEKIILGLQRGLATPEKTLVWIDKAVAQAASQLQKHAPEQLASILKDGAARATPEKIARWEDWAKRQKGIQK